MCRFRCHKYDFGRADPDPFHSEEVNQFFAALDKVPQFFRPQFGCLDVGEFQQISVFLLLSVRRRWPLAVARVIVKEDDLRID